MHAQRPLTAATLALLLSCAASAGAAGSSPVAAPDARTLERARTLVASMKAAERGPYKHLRWYCGDGTVHPPKPYPCEERGGGHQHAEHSADRQELARLGWSVGTIFTALSWEELLDAGRDHDRLRQLSLERYLEEVDQGWVLRRARTYRGHVQVEDEEVFGEALLHRLLAESKLVRSEYLLVREAARTIPHGGAGEDASRQARRQSKELSALDPSFEPLRIRIHTNPRTAELEDTRAWLAEARRRGAASAALILAEQLASSLERMESGRAGPALRARVLELGRGRPWGAELARLLRSAESAPPAERTESLAAVLELVRRKVEGGAPPKEALALLELSISVEGQLLKAGLAALDAPNLSRRQALELARHLAGGAHGAGWLSEGEVQDLRGRLDAALAEDPAPTKRLAAAARQLERSAAWAQGAVHHGYAGALVRYAALEPKAVHFVDDLLRGSVMLPLAAIARRLATDAAALSGVRTTAFGKEAPGLAGLNPGLSIGRLRVLSEADLAAGRQARPDEIVVLPRTVSELEPVAGILSVDEGNVLSHVQLLARNLGIPNVAVSAALAPELARRDGMEVILAVSPDGSVALHELAAVRGRLPDGVGAVGAPSPDDERVRVTVPRPRLEIRDPLPLDQLHAGLSGRVVGPKAANLGELARLFPGRVSPAIGLPFGLFAAHAAVGEDSPKARLRSAFEAHREGRLDEAGLAARVEEVRQAVAALQLLPESKAALSALMRERFGPPGSYGLFVRSDTNVEDLPGFTGAGLNLTVPHVVGLEAQLGAIPEVWASPFRPRAMAWRARALANPDEVYPSVLLQKSVPADKSGVLVTTDLIGRGEGLTVASAWGVGGAVDGESAETLVLRPDGGVDLVAQAKAPYRRRLARSGGVTWERAPAGPVLTLDEQRQLRELADEARSRLEPAAGPDGRPLPWDIEFGFEDGRLRLFQVRPLVERSASRAARVVAALNGPPPPPVPAAPLDRPPTGGGKDS